MKEKRKIKVIVSVTSDLVTDQRVHKVSDTLFKNNYDVLLVGRKLKSSLPLSERDYKTHRFNLIFSKGPLFYAEYNLRLFFFLLFKRTDLLLANDLDTLLPNYLNSIIRNKTLVYDNHEYYTGVPELQNRRIVRSVWKAIESFIFPRLKHIYTVNDSIANLYSVEYKRPLAVVRNIPLLTETSSTRPSEFAEDKQIILYQGAGINVDRGVEELIQAMQFVENAMLFIVGGGDALEEIKKLVINLSLPDKVKFIGKVPFQELKRFTAHADIGVSIDKDTNINYRFSLPNKVFDYIHAGLPILASDLPEVRKVVEGYSVGTFINSHDPKHIAEVITKMLGNNEQKELWKSNALKAAKDLNWQEEQKIVLRIFEEASKGK